MTISVFSASRIQFAARRRTQWSSSGDGDSSSVSSRPEGHTQFSVTGLSHVLGAGFTALRGELEEIQRDNQGVDQVLVSLPEGVDSFVVLGRGSNNAPADINPAATPDRYMSRQHVTVKWLSTHEKYPDGCYS